MPRTCSTYGAEIVVIATGSHWRDDGMNGPTQAPIPGAEAANVFTPEQVFAAKGDVAGDHVVVYDTDGYFTAVAMIELLQRAGKRVTAITPFPNLGPYLFLTGEAFRINRELRAAGVEIVTSHVVLELDGTRLAGVHAFSDPTRSSGAPTASCSSPSASPTTRSTTSSLRSRSGGRPRRSRRCTGSATASPRG